MLPLTFQVQTVCNNIKNTIVRVTGEELPAVEDNEKTFAELQARYDSVIKLLENVDKAKFDAKAHEEITFKFGPTEHKSTPYALIQNFSITNFYFHITTLYVIFRNKGAPLGKSDYLRGAQ